MGWLNLLTNCHHVFLFDIAAGHHLVNTDTDNQPSTIPGASRVEKYFCHWNNKGDGQANNTP
jgi:hypothetical protein